METKAEKQRDRKEIRVHEYDMASFSHKSLEERAAAYGGKLGPYNEYDWGDYIERESWRDGILPI